MVYKWVRVSGEGQDKANEKAERFLTMITDPDKRIYFAEKFLNYDVALDVSKPWRGSLFGTHRVCFRLW